MSAIQKWGLQKLKEENIFVLSFVDCLYVLRYFEIFQGDNLELCTLLIWVMP